MSIVPFERLEAAYQTALESLLAERHSSGYWEGELSTSALSTATAVMALSMVQQRVPNSGPFDSLIMGGLNWLVANQNADGGFGDTVKSFSNISTTMLVRSALHITQTTKKYAHTLQRLEDWLGERYGRTPAKLAEAVRARYGKDRTFSVPILTTCALAGLVDWKEVPHLPFELACFPQSWFAMLRLHVVSYSLPALIAIGQCIHRHRPPWNPIVRIIRWLARNRSLTVLEKIQPSNGGFLEAAPLTSFVTLSLAAIGEGDGPVARKGVEFLLGNVRSDGSWPIDTHLSTWVTTLAINSLASGNELQHIAQHEELLGWLLSQQYRSRHPYTGAEPGAWAWTPLPGGVPDSDDTPGALLAISHLITSERSTSRSANKGSTNVDVAENDTKKDNAELQSCAGVNWLLRLQNSDGGWPTFCRGWGALPFDRSGTDLTAHALRALHVWQSRLTPESEKANAKPYIVHEGRTIPIPSLKQYKGATERGFRYLAKQQRSDGSWLPLWFGNQHAPDDINPTYGTAKVLAAYRDLDRMYQEQARKGVEWLLTNQNEDGGWGAGRGTPSSIEETALAVEALLETGRETDTAVNKGLLWLVEQVERGRLAAPTPIGFYFAKLWYFEKMYPIVFTVAALGCARERRVLTEIRYGK
ncbi:MAG: prenyltransferase/squalene oxidase repeat-containing protein [Gemmataceae bacterium]